MDQQILLNLLRMAGGAGGSMPSQAGQAMMGRPGQIDAAVQQQSGGVPMPATPQPQAMPGMSQSQFGNAGPMDPRVKQQMLIQALRNRTAPSP